MSSLKYLRDRVKVVKSTHKITTAMKMVAGSKLRRQQNALEQSLPYKNLLREITLRLLANLEEPFDHPFLRTKVEAKDNYVVLIITGDKGLCGHFNQSIIDKAQTFLRTLKSNGTPFKVVFWGRKGWDAMKKEFEEFLYDPVTPFLFSSQITLDDLILFTNNLAADMENGLLGSLIVFHTQFHSVLKQESCHKTLLPFQEELPSSANQLDVDYEPEPKTLLPELLKRYCTAQAFGMLLETLTSEQASRMTAMEASSRNAKDMIKKLQITYNRTRQTLITKELIEIVSGAECLQN